MVAVQARVVGILNITEDSFSDGGLFLSPERAVARGLELASSGADYVELGAASSHPDSRSVSPGQEIERLSPVIDALHAQGARLAVDTRNPLTQRFCIERNVELINDIEGFAQPEIYPDLARSRCALVVMHSVRPGERASRVRTDPDAVLAGIETFFSARVTALTAAGICRDRIILDPGMGLFLGSNPEPSLRVLAELQVLRRRLDLPMLISVSRKGFLRDVTGRAVGERAPATLAAEIWAALQGVEYIRTHDVAALRDALNVLKAIDRMPRS